MSSEGEKDGRVVSWEGGKGERIVRWHSWRRWKVGGGKLEMVAG